MNVSAGKASTCCTFRMVFGCCEDIEMSTLVAKLEYPCNAEIAGSVGAAKISLSDKRDDVAAGVLRSGKLCGLASWANKADTYSGTYSPAGLPQTIFFSRISITQWHRIR